MQSHRTLCPLCCSVETSAPFFVSDNGTRYYLCLICDLRFLDPEQRLSSEAERDRYLLHNNDVEDLRYQEFVTPLVQLVVSNASIDSCGLDFGAGTGPVLTKLLRQAGFKMDCYDPFFHPDPNLLKKKYDFIVSCEVVEHFYNPGNEFQTLFQLLKTGAFLGIKTLLYENKISFGTWFYRLDPTHVVFYSEKTFKWIQKFYGFTEVLFPSPRVIVLKR